MKHKLKNIRPKAMGGALAAGLIGAGASLLGSLFGGISQSNAAEEQAKAIKEAAKTNAKALAEQNENNTRLAKENINFTKEQNQINREIRKNDQLTLQLLAGQETLADRQEANKIVLKKGGSIPMRHKLKSIPSYGGVPFPFKVTDGGGVIPLNIDNNGYGLYEIYGNDHEHYHKSPGGKNKTGVGIKFSDGSVVEGEGNQNTNQGELLYVTPNDAMFLSKHSIDGFNPTQAVNAGMHPEEAFIVQQTIKAKKGINDEGKKIIKRKSIKKESGGIVPLEPENIITGIITDNNPTETGVVYNTRRSIKRCGGRKKAYPGMYNPWGYQTSYDGTNPWSNNGTVYSPPSLTNNTTTPTSNSMTNPIITTPSRSNFGFGDIMNNYGGALINAGGTLGGAIIGTIGNDYANKVLGIAYNDAANIYSKAYKNLKTIDENFIKESDYAAPHTMAVVRRADTNINPQLERNRRLSAAENREVNRNTISSAARLNRLAAISDRLQQRNSELYASKHNQDEAIKQANAERITQVTQANADRDIKARQDFTKDLLSLKMYNNDIINQRTLGSAQARTEALTQSGLSSAQTSQANASTWAGALSNIGSGFASTFDGLRQDANNYRNIMLGADTSSKIDVLVMNPNNPQNRAEARRLYDSLNGINTDLAKTNAARLRKVFRFA